jgi:tRNA threonylcarbamoyladenosine biosynthesis protein TsaE
MSIEIKSIDDLPVGARLFMDSILDRKVFAFEAPMGAGKTTFILAVLKVMGVECMDGSPTYSLVNSYESATFGKIHHFDFYRLNSEIEALDIGLEEMLYGKGYCFIEWPEKIQGLLPENTSWVQIHVNEKKERLISLQK